MLKEITEEYLGALNRINIIEREAKLPSGPDIKAIIGVRRVGKTVLMLQRVRELLEKGENAVYISFDEPEIRKLNHRELAEEVRREFPSGNVHLFLDEVQEWEEWDARIRWLHDVGDFDIYISGSSSTLLSSEIPSRLRGRYISRVILPFSFREVSPQDTKTFRNRGKIRKVLDDYLRWGSFPEVWTFKSREKIISIVETVFYRDIIERFKIREIKEFEDFFYYVFSLYSSYFTYRSLQRALASWIKLSVKTVMNYLKYMESSMLIYTLPTFSPSQREIIRKPRKLYIVDHGLANLFFRGMDMGRRIENVVFLELLRRKLYRNPLLKIFYYSGSEGEVDFVLVEGNKVIELIQVTVEVTPANYKREVEGLIKVGRKLKCNNLTLVTLERSDVDGVKVIPLWEFLLKD